MEEAVCERPSGPTQHVVSDNRTYFAVGLGSRVDGEGVEEECHSKPVDFSWKKEKKMLNDVNSSESNMITP